MKRAGIVLLAMIFTVSLAVAQNKLTFDNQSDAVAQVTIVNASGKVMNMKQVEVKSGARRSIELPAGKYKTKVRFGATGQYVYDKGSLLDLKGTAGAPTEQTIELIMPEIDTSVPAAVPEVPAKEEKPVKVAEEPWKLMMREFCNLSFDQMMAEAGAQAQKDKSTNLEAQAPAKSVFMPAFNSDKAVATIADVVNTYGQPTGAVTAEYDGLTMKEYYWGPVFLVAADMTSTPTKHGVDWKLLGSNPWEQK